MTIDKIPTDAEIVHEFIDERDEYAIMMEHDNVSGYDYARWTGHMESRGNLAVQLDDAKRQRREAADTAIERCRTAMNAAAENVIAFIEAFGSATERPAGKPGPDAYLVAEFFSGGKPIGTWTSREPGITGPADLESASAHRAMEPPLEIADGCRYYWVTPAEPEAGGDDG